jgi:LCP family protein required for cell wall assembly
MRRRRVRGRRGGGEWAWVIIAAALLGVVVILSMSFFLILRASQDKPEVIPTAAAELPTPVDARNDQSNINSNIATGQQVVLDDGRSIVLEPWDGKSRFTVLAMGIDRRPSETGLAYRTDTMLLISLEPATHNVGILSIPRDLFVVVPGYSQPQRVNSAMVLGELRQPGYGPKLAMQTVQYNLGMRVHDYVVVDFNAFETVVDAIGGIDIDVPYTISDPYYPDMYYGYDPFYITAGPHHLNGQIALKYARTRHGDSDFERATRQQQVLYAIRQRILDTNILPQWIVQAPSMLGALKNNVYSGLTVDQLIQLAWYLKDVPQSNIHNGVISGEYTLPYTTSDGASVLIPNRTRIGPLLVNVFGASYSS